MNTIDRQGFATLIGRLSAMGRGAVKALRAGVRKGQVVLSDAMGLAAPKGKTRVVNGHDVQPGSLAASFGSGMGRTKSDGSFTAKTGLAVGKDKGDFGEQITKGAKRGVPYGHFRSLGTQIRETGFKTRKLRSGKIKRKRTGNHVMNRGKVDPLPYIMNAANAAESTSENAILTELEKQIAKQMQGQ